MMNELVGMLAITAVTGYTVPAKADERGFLQLDDYNNQKKTVNCGPVMIWRLEYDSLTFLNPFP